MITSHLNIPISTVENIMTTTLYTWNPLEKDKQTIQAEADALTYDTVPIVRNGDIVGLLDIRTGNEDRITYDLLLSRDTPIPDALHLLATSQHQSFLVLYGQNIQGIITPSDFNKVMARSYFYNLLAILEMELAEKTRLYYPDTTLIVEILQPEGKTFEQYRKDILDRSSGRDRKVFGLDLIHSLMLSEFEQLIMCDEKFRKHLRFEDEASCQKLFDKINGNFRRKVMHPTRPLLNDRYGIEDLNTQVHQVIEGGA